MSISYFTIASTSKRRLRASSSLRAIAGVVFAGVAGAGGAPLVGAFADDATETEVIVVEGRRISEAFSAIGVGEPTNTVAVTREALLSAPAGISGLKMLEGLPGFNVQTDGALGLYEFGNSVTVRAFNLEQIGFVLDGIPMGRSDAFGGSPIFRYVDNENLGQVRASPGAGDVALPSYASLGPIVEYLTVEPSEEFSGTISQAFGDDELNRSFVKLQTGLIGGFSGYLSRSKTDSNLWRGAGSIDREHIEGKAQYAFKFQFVYNDFFDYDSPTMSRATYESTTPDLNGNTGRDIGYVDFTPAGCLVAPAPADYVDFNNDGVIDDMDFQPVATGGVCTQNNTDRVNIREDLLYGLTFESQLTDTLAFSATAYLDDKDGYGVSPDGYANTRGRYLDQIDVGLDVTHPRGVQYGLSTVGGERKGVTAGFAWDVANHLLEAGFWTESEDYNRTQARINKTDGAPDGSPIFDETAYFRRDYVSTRDTLQLYLKDTFSLLDDRLTMTLGVKSLDIDYELSGYRDYNDYAIRVGDPGGGDTLPGFGPQTVMADYSENFLPLAGAVYDLTDTDQVFASYSQNFALPRGADDIFSVANSATPPPAPEGEMSENFEIGFRTNRPQFNAAVAAFYTSFENRLESASVLNPATGQPESYATNVGETTAYGVELTGVWQPEFFDDRVYFNANVTYNKSEFQDDLGTLPIAGNTLPDSPEWLVVAGATVEPTDWVVANLSMKYTGERYADYINTQEMEAYTVWSGYVDLGDGFGAGPLSNIKVRANVDNIFDEDVLAFTFTTVSGTAFYRPLNPRTFQISITGEF